MAEYTIHTETCEASGLTLKIIADPYGGAHNNPAEEDEAIVFAVLHGRYSNSERAKGLGLTTPEAIEAYAHEKRATWAAFPLYLYDHSGTTYRASQGGNPFVGRLPQGHAEFDSGRVGSIFVDFEAVGCKKSWKKAQKLAHAFKAAQGFCEYYTDWANGNIWGYVIEDEDGEHVDSCWGFIGDWDGDDLALDAGREALEHFAEDAKAAKAAALAEEIAEEAAALEASRPDLYAHA